METKDCNLCIDRRGARWSELLAAGSKTTKEAALAFGMTQKEVEEHLFTHAGLEVWTKEADSQEQYDRGYYIHKLDALGRDLQRWLDDVLDRSNINSESVKSVTALSKELRETLRLLAEVTKVIKDEDLAKTERAMIELRNNYMTLTNILTSQTCPECQKKILDAIDMQQKLLGK